MTAITFDLILNRLQSCYDLSASADEFLHFEDSYQILIATILSAQTTDKTVNLVTKELFHRYNTPTALAASDLSDVETIIKRTGFFHAKAKNIINTAKILVAQYNGEVPDDINQLQTLPGVGRKTANIVMSHAFGKNIGIAVDTHVKRVSGRLGLTTSKAPETIEKDLLNFFPPNTWGEINGLFILHGRKTCTAKNPKCQSCIFNDICKYNQSD